MKEQVIHLEAHDDINSARDKLGWIRAPKVLVVFPDDAARRILQRKLDLVILQRQATRKQAQIALITRDPIVLEHARELGIATFRSIEASRRRRWRTEEAAISVSRDEQPMPLSPELASAGTRLTPLPQRGNLSRQTLIVIIVVAGIITLFALLIFGPSATVTLDLADETISVSSQITADPGASAIDVTTRTIPARVIGIEIEGEESIATTGIKQIPSTRAAGVALLTNLIPDQITIPAGTILKTSASQPVEFQTLRDVTVPGTIGETVEVPIEAVAAGFTGNLPANRINEVEGPLGARVGVTNPEPTAGGDTVESPAVIEADQERLRSLLLQQLQQRAFAEIPNDPLIGLNETDFVPLETLEVVLINDETFDAYPGQVAAELNLSMTVTIQGIAIDERLARQVIYNELSGLIGEGYRINPESLVFQRMTVVAIDDNRRVTFVMQGEAMVTPQVDQVSLKREIAASWADRISGRLNSTLALNGPITIEISPAFWPFTPLVPGRITIVEQ